jgi:hypothetical protein
LTLPDVLNTLGFGFKDLGRRNMNAQATDVSPLSGRELAALAKLEPFGSPDGI